MIEDRSYKVLFSRQLAAYDAEMAANYKSYKKADKQEMNEWYRDLSTNIDCLVKNISNKGFIIIGKGVRCHPEADYFIEQAYIVPSHRGEKWMTLAVRMFVIYHPGIYVLQVIDGNKRAEKFWNTVFMSLGYERKELSLIEGTVQSGCHQIAYGPVDRVVQTIAGS